MDININPIPPHQNNLNIVHQNQAEIFNNNQALRPDPIVHRNIEIPQAPRVAMNFAQAFEVMRAARERAREAADRLAAGNLQGKVQVQEAPMEIDLGEAQRVVG